MQKLKTIDAETLMTTPLPAVRFVVERLLPQGLHVLAGASKVGKSWLSLWLCLQVAKGEKVWEFPVKSGTVLYLCLEDSFSRVQSRLFQITDDAPPSLHFATIAGSIGNGLEEQINDFISEHPDTTFIVIDTLQKVRTANTTANPYANDYQDLSSLKTLADQHHIAILLVHHVRKIHDDDPFNMISGTTGISGAADTNFVLMKKKRGGSEAMLYCVGRDIEYRELALLFRKETHIWEMAEPMEEQERQPVDPEVLCLTEFLRGVCPFDGTATELSTLLEQQTGEQLLPSVLSKRLTKHSGELDRLGVRISSARTRDSRTLHIRCDGNDGNDGKKDTDSVSNLLSQPSHLSPPEKAAAVSPCVAISAAG